MTVPAPTSAQRAANGLVWGFVALVLVFLYAPMVPPVLRSFAGASVENGGLFASYRAIFDDPLLIGGIWNTVMIGAIVAVVTPVLALAIAQALREWQKPRLILGLVLLPLFVPGVSMGVAMAVFFKVLGVEPSLLTMSVVQILWALPFATLVIMTVMASFDETYLEAAYVLGSNRFAAFWKVELPCIRQGLFGAAAFSLILSFNETIRTSIVQGGRNTVQTYLWSQYQQVGLSPALYALMTLLIVATLALMAGIVVVTRRRQLP
ncbi:ABC-type spermidine/putrescine transport system permease subunit II [Rhodobium orientis]|uniref:ABC transmembrane type-1 domain-containing protein n=1 Tax=Rhodobium orientis TaxID=34017 RepID=A0A327JX88_9HYPH|nr:ABC transporter permease subunit [Rhodobium orientis]MBB4301016.1 ABC-type spermidine/putrescine transport system permease subunit II [Rhodobium orientis]MBK5949683.1 hypothetical protein [Rhodobium orientis]RAI30195.1 hypothetical protein CH339_01330 [Rhodobium orientis]